MTIALVIHKTHEYEPRERKKCNWCDKRRLCTRETVGHIGSSETWDEWICNECLTMTPPWMTAKVGGMRKR